MAFNTHSPHEDNSRLFPSLGVFFRKHAHNFEEMSPSNSSGSSNKWKIGTHSDAGTQTILTSKAGNDALPNAESRLCDLFLLADLRGSPHSHNGEHDDDIDIDEDEEEYSGALAAINRIPPARRNNHVWSTPMRSQPSSSSSSSSSAAAAGRISVFSPGLSPIPVTNNTPRRLLSTQMDVKSGHKFLHGITPVKLLEIEKVRDVFYLIFFSFSCSNSSHFY